MSIIVQKFGGTSVVSEKNREEVANKIIEKIKNGYKVVAVVSAMGRSGDPYSTDSLINLINEEYVERRELDLLMSCGEIISAAILSNLLSTKGYRNMVLTGSQAGILTDDNFGSANVLEVHPEKILANLEKKDVIIISGFQGATKSGEITTLGRGGSDTSALIIGEVLDCEHVEIYTDVDGVMTADPKVVLDAKLIERICYSEAYQLVEEGAKIIHSKAVEIAERCNIKVIIKNALNNCSGTIIDCFNYNTKSHNSIITSITYKKDRVQIAVDLNDTDKRLEELLTSISDKQISIDLISLLPGKKVFTIDNKDLLITEEILKSRNYEYNIIANCCKISVIGHRIQGVPGVMARIISALSNNNVSILQSSDSHTTIWCLVKEEDSEKSLNALHKEFFK